MKNGNNGVGIAALGIGGLLWKNKRIKDMQREIEEIETQAMRSCREQTQKNEEILKELGKQKLSVCIKEVKDFVNYYSLINNVDIVSKDMIGDTCQDTTREIIIKIEKMIERALKDVKENENETIWATYSKLQTYKEKMKYIDMKYVAMTGPRYLYREMYMTEKLKYAREIAELSKEEVKELKWIYRAAKGLYELINENTTLLGNLNMEMKNILKRTCDWRCFTEVEKELVIGIIKNVLRIQEMVELPLIEESGKLSERAMDFFERESNNLFTIGE